jgi:hypothetical protein
VCGLVRRCGPGARKLCIGENPFNFPAVKDRKKDGDHHHAYIEMLNRALESMPGINFGPHGARYALGTYGERDLGFVKSEAKVILDHGECTGVFVSRGGIGKYEDALWCEVKWDSEHAKGPLITHLYELEKIANPMPE